MLNITVCILSFNRPQYLVDALESVMQQTVAPKEIIIFDNGSNEDVFESVQFFLKNGVQWKGSDKTNSATWNFNRAIASVKTKYVFVMHDDDKLCSNFIKEQFEYLESNPEIGAVSCNGFIIDEKSERNGKLVRPGFVNSDVELYKCSVDVAIRYASDSCIPFSPVVYRTNLIREIQFREEFGKFCDAPFFCDIADKSIVAYRSDILYECRVHPGQDSGHFPIELVEKLEGFLSSRKSHNSNDIILLQSLLRRQHTARTLRILLKSNNLWKDLKRLKNKMFSVICAFELFLKLLKNRIKNY